MAHVVKFFYSSSSKPKAPDLAPVLCKGEKEAFEHAITKDSEERVLLRAQRRVVIDRRFFSMCEELFVRTHVSANGS
jgi:hypothetical protein